MLASLKSESQLEHLNIVQGIFQLYKKMLENVNIFQGKISIKISFIKRICIEVVLIHATIICTTTTRILYVSQYYKYCSRRYKYTPELN